MAIKIPITIEKICYNVFMHYDRFQAEAINYINQAESVVVCAPTGAGKTAIAEYVIEKSLKKEQSIIYTAPIKALSNRCIIKFRRPSAGYDYRDIPQ